MRKIIAMLLVLVMLMSALTACSLAGKETQPSQGPDMGYTQPSSTPDDDPPSQSGLPEGMLGTDAIKLLLADERLSGKLIEDSDSIFAGGEETMRTLAARARGNQNLQLRTLSYAADAPAQSAFNLRDASSEMTGFDEISRNYVEFEDTTRQIVSQAERAADMIKFVKQYIRILDTWVESPHTSGEELYLHVEENSETIYRRYEDQYTICHRYRNELGEDVYEICANYEFATIRFTYIAGKKYELMHKMENGTRYQGISANNDKGYWEIFSVIYDSNWVEYNFDTNFIIMKDDICYKAGYSLREGSGINYTITTADRKADLMLIVEDATTTFFDIQLGSFQGYYGVVDIVPGNMGKLKLADGRLIDAGVLDVSHLDDRYNVDINGVYASETAFGKEGNIMISISGEDPASRRALLLRILSDWGITCKYDMAQTFAAVDRADSEFIMMRKYLRWNGHDVNTMEGLMAGVDVERSLFDLFLAQYNAVKDVAVVQIGTEAAELLVRFAPITDGRLDGASVQGLAVTVGDISLTVSDMLLFVKDVEYKLAFAMQSMADGSLTHIEANTTAAAYDSGQQLTVAEQDLIFMLPMLSPGEYKLVAYVATADGIRSSACTELQITEITDPVTKEGNRKATVEAENAWLKVTYAETAEAVTTIVRYEATPYAVFYELMAEIAFRYGIPGQELIRKVDPETMETTELLGNEEDMEDGMYVISYSFADGEKTVSGQLYVEYVREELPPDSGEENPEEKPEDPKLEEEDNTAG